MTESLLMLMKIEYSELILGLIKVCLSLYVLVPFLLTLIVTYSAYGIFNKAGVNKYYSFIPFWNVVLLAEIAKIRITSTILLLVPIINVIYVIYYLSKLAKAFKLEGMWKWLMIFAPYGMMLYVSFGKFVYKYKNPKDIKIESVVDQMPSLITQSELDKQNKDTEPEEKVDSIFKAKIDEIEKPAPYKSYRVNTMENEQITKDREKLTGKLLEPEQVTLTNLNLEQEKDKDKIEVIDLE